MNEDKVVLGLLRELGRFVELMDIENDKRHDHTQRQNNLQLEALAVLGNDIRELRRQIAKMTQFFDAPDINNPENEIPF